MQSLLFTAANHVITVIGWAAIFAFVIAMTLFMVSRIPYDSVRTLTDSVRFFTKASLAAAMAWSVWSLVDVPLRAWTSSIEDSWSILSLFGPMSPMTYVAVNTEAALHQVLLVVFGVPLIIGILTLVHDIIDPPSRRNRRLAR
jgi:hypothetical protein